MGNFGRADIGAGGVAFLAEFLQTAAKRRMDEVISTL